MRTVLLKRILIMGVTSLGWFTPVFAAQPPSVNSKGVNVKTRYMMVFSGLENELLTAQATGDKSVLLARLSPFFELNTANHHRLTREAFVSRKPDAHKQQISGLRVYEVGENAVANFVLHTEGQGDLSVVDVWSKNGEKWQLRVRFEANY
ncbi:nuclear transport factor 2 family protein [Microbulbifer hainanensis]|uniref:nuclear transport factor 2 family protein n=1 Tax=Microbulbifer hainanensis TaxID=2735675 RepID=UPI001D02BB8F|nr:nuclear transport factor 2 family protein [Microbulbifer hainanensis]